MNKKNVVQAGARKSAGGKAQTLVLGRLLSPARRVLRQVSRAQAARRAAAEAQKAEAREQVKTAIQAAEDARAGKPVSAAVARAESRRDALLAAEFKAAERRGASAERPGEINRKDALTNAEIAALIRKELTDLF